LLRLKLSKKSGVPPSEKGGTYRATSPPAAGSFDLDHLGPRSARCIVANGPAPYCSIEITRRSENGDVTPV
jgi:hypothetical protein